MRGFPARVKGLPLAPALAPVLAPALAPALALALAMAVLAGPGLDPAAAASRTTSPSWGLKLAIRYFPSAGNHSQYDTVLAQGRTAWFLGGSNFSGRGVPEVEQRSNGRWHQSVLPSGLRSWITGASAISPDDIWAVTYLGGTVLNWNGSQWASEPSGRWNDYARFTGIVAFSPTNLWLFGSRSRGGIGAGTWHLAGSAWTEVRGAAAGIYKASAISATDMWAIGEAKGTVDALLRYRGSAWSRVTPAALAGFTYSYVLALRPSSVWVAGSVDGTPELGHYDGHGWTASTMPSSAPASGMCRDGRGGLWVIANSGLGPSSVYDRSAAGKWTAVAVSRTSANEVLDCALVPGTAAAWGAGKSAAPSGTAAAAYGYGNVP
jgi:hypothetical protein